MNHIEMLSRLIEQAEAGGSDLLQLRAIVEEASDAGATRALDRLGLADPSAREDMDELRKLLAAWREAKRGVWRSAVDWLVKALVALMLIGLAVKLGLGEMLA